LMAHRALGTYERAVDAFIALSEFSKGKFVAAGMEPGRIFIKPNFVEDAGDGLPDGRVGGLFVGRLSDEKGVWVLLEALKQGGSVELIGEGEWFERAKVQLGSLAPGFLPMPAIIEKMKRAAFLVLPSLCGENFPRTLAEAYSCGLPVIASRVGALAELVKDGETGLLFETGNAQDLAAKLAWAQANPQAMREMGRQARKRYEELYSPPTNHRRLLEVYEAARAARAASVA